MHVLMNGIIIQFCRHYLLGQSMLLYIEVTHALMCIRGNVSIYRTKDSV